MPGIGQAGGHEAADRSGPGDEEPHLGASLRSTATLQAGQGGPTISPDACNLVTPATLGKLLSAAGEGSSSPDQSGNEYLGNAYDSNGCTWSDASTGTDLGVLETIFKGSIGIFDAHSSLEYGVQLYLEQAAAKGADTIGAGTQPVAGLGSQ